jgi:hypothetical protein
MDEELFGILEEALQEALDVGSRGTATVHTAAGMAVHTMRRIQDSEAE